MATCGEEELTECISDERPSPQWEEQEQEQEQEEYEDEDEDEDEDDEDEELDGSPKKTSRGLTDILLDLSEENDMKELEPHLYAGVEENVFGWERVAPLSCILVTLKTPAEVKQKKDDTSTNNSSNSTPVTEDSSPSIAATPGPSDQQAGTWINKAVAALQLDTKKWSSYDAMKKSPSHHPPEMIKEGEALRKSLQSEDLSTKCTASEKIPNKSQKPRLKSISNPVPVKNFTFLPPLKPPQLSSKGGGRGRKAAAVDNSQERYFSLDKKSRRRGRRDEPVSNAGFATPAVAMTSKHQPSQHTSLLTFTGISNPKRFPMATASKYDTMHHGRC